VDDPVMEVDPVPMLDGLVMVDDPVMAADPAPMLDGLVMVDDPVMAKDPVPMLDNPVMLPPPLDPPPMPLAMTVDDIANTIADTAITLCIFFITCYSLNFKIAGLREVSRLHPALRTTTSVG
jgi:hypothetical protein